MRKVIQRSSGASPVELDVFSTNESLQPTMNIKMSGISTIAKKRRVLATRTISISLVHFHSIHISVLPGGNIMNFLKCAVK